MITMKNEHGLKMLRKLLAHGNMYARSFHSMLTAMSWTLHGDMITSLAFLNKALIKVYYNCVNRILNSEIGGSGIYRFEKNVLCIENVVNKKILSDECNPAQ